MGAHVVHAGVHAGTEPQIEPVEGLGAIGDGHPDQVEPLLEGPQLQRRCNVLHFWEYRMRSAERIAGFDPQRHLRKQVGQKCDPRLSP